MPTPSLLALDPTDVAAALVQRVTDHLHSLALSLSPGLELRLVGDPRSSDLHATMQALTLYAQRGCSEERPVWDWTDSGMASDGMLSVLSVLYSRAADGGLAETAIDVSDLSDPDDPVSLVLVAAAARIRLDEVASLRVRELAVLAGLSARRVQQLGAAGEIAVTRTPGAPVSEGGLVEAAEARRWLAARGVPGVAP